MGAVSPSNPVIRALSEILREKGYPFEVKAGSKTHKLEFTIHGKVCCVGVSFGSSGMDMKLRAARRQLHEVIDAEEQAFEALKEKALQEEREREEAQRTKAIPKGDWRKIRYGEEGDDWCVWMAEDAPTIDDIFEFTADDALVQSGRHRPGLVVCTGLGKPFKAEPGMEEDLEPEWVVAKAECVTVAFRRLDAEEEHRVIETLAA